MKVKDLESTSNTAWSPAVQHDPVYLAVGTAAQQLDATFNTSSTIEIYTLDLADRGLAMPKVASLPVPNRFHKLVWSDSGMREGSRPNGVIVGALDGGAILGYDASKLIQGGEESSKSILFSKDKHTGAVQAIDFNPFQSNLLASGASESEIYIWDLNKMETPMSPGNKSQPPDDVRCLSWNRQVQHILASTFSSRCVVWDLRKTDPIIKVSDSTSRMRYKVVAWHPDIATQLCLASEDDHSPLIQIWDLRLASSPLRTLEYHHRGILSLSWCQQDSDLLLSCGKDNRILCVNPNTSSEAVATHDVAEIASGSTWSFDVSFCPQNPGVISSSSFDGHVSIYSLMGGGGGGTEGKSDNSSFAVTEVDTQLKRPPKWLRRPCGASFGFGGRLVSFGLEEDRKIYVSSVVTEPELVDRSLKLETSISNQNFEEFCIDKIHSTVDSDELQIWKFIKANFEPNPRETFLDLLGYPITSVDELSEKLKDEKLNGDVFDVIQSDQTPISIDSGPLSKALLCGNIEDAVRICLEENRMADALILAIQGGNELFEKTKKEYFAKNKSKEKDLIRAVTTGEWTQFMSRVEVDSSWIQALATAMTYSPTQEDLSSLCSSLGNRLKGTPALLCYICAGDLDNVVRTWIESKETQTSDKLQDLVEVVMTLKRAHKRLNGTEPNIQKDGPLAEKLTQYANLLAAQGALNAAATYVDLDSVSSSSAVDYTDPVAIFRDRVRGAMGMNKSRPNGTQQGSRTSKFGHRQRNLSSHPPYPADNYGHNNYSGSYSNYSGYNPPVGQPVTMFDPGRSDMIVPPTENNSSHPYPNFPSSPYDQQHTKEGIPPQLFNPATEIPKMAPLSTPMGDNQNRAHMPPTSNGPGWNDPPPLMVKAKTPSGTRTTRSMSRPDPITTPLFNPAGNGELNPQTENYDTNSYYGSQPTTDYHYSQQPLMPPPPQQQQQQPMIPAQMMSPQPQQQQQQQQQQMRSPTPVIQKGPIPAEHQILQDVFEGLRQKCLSAANHPQMKRKLDDVAKKLEILYDKLRDNSLPEATLNGLHQLPSYVWAYDYNSCLQMVNSLVSTGSFSVLSQFLTGVKVLFQVANQLGVYIERTSSN